MAILEKQCEDATASVAYSTFSKFSPQKIKDLALQVNEEHHKLLDKLCYTLDEIREIHMTFGNMFVVL